MAEYQKYHMAHLSIFSFENIPPLPRIFFVAQIPGHWVWPAATLSTVGRESFPSRRTVCSEVALPKQPDCVTLTAANEHQSQREKQL